MIKVRGFHKFSLSQLIQRAHAKITVDPAESHQLYTLLTSDFRNKLNQRSSQSAGPGPHSHSSSSSHSVPHSLATTVAKLHLSDHRHVRLVNLLSKSPASAPASSATLGAPDDHNHLLPPTTSTTQTTLLPDLYAALTHVPEADPSDYALAIHLTNQHSPTRTLALRECQKIYALYLARHNNTPLDPGLDDALDPLTQLVRTYLVHGHIADALALVDPLLSSPAFTAWLTAPQSPDSPTATSRYASALHLFAQTMAGLRLHADLDTAARVFRAAQRLLNMDLYFAFEARPPFTSHPAPLVDQSAIVQHLAATLDADKVRAIWLAASATSDVRRLGVKLHLSPRAWASMWHVLTVGGYAKDGYRVLVERMVVGDKLDARVAASVVGELFANNSSQGGQDDHRHDVAMLTLDRVLAKWPSVRLADHVWVAVFHGVPAMTHLTAAPHDAAAKWWVPLSKMASAHDPTRLVRQIQAHSATPPTYLEQLVNLYAAYLSRTPSASPAASVGSAFVDAVCTHMADDRISEDEVRGVVQAWLTGRETDRVMGWIRSRRGGGVEASTSTSTSTSRGGLVGVEEASPA